MHDAREPRHSSHSLPPLGPSYVHQTVFGLSSFFWAPKPCITLLFLHWTVSMVLIPSFNSNAVLPDRNSLAPILPSIWFATKLRFRPKWQTRLSSCWKLLAHLHLLYPAFDILQLHTVPLVSISSSTPTPKPSRSEFPICGLAFQKTNPQRTATLGSHACPSTISFHFPHTHTCYPTVHPEWKERRNAAALKMWMTRY